MSGSILALNITSEDVKMAEIGQENGQRIVLRLYHYIPEEEKASYLKAADIFILPSLRDPWGLTINEAMVCEKPIITTWDVGAKELVRDNGIVVPSGDEEKLYEAMRDLLADRELLFEKGRKSWEYVQEYSIENESRAFLDALRYVLSMQEH